AFVVKVIDHPEEKLNTGSASKAEPLHGGDQAFESLRAHSFFGELREKGRWWGFGCRAVS
ncbi:MAG: hypothetical protein ACXV2A_04815, partial [Halobacteriota archaeon]